MLGSIVQPGAKLNPFDELAPTLLKVTRNISTEIDLEWTVNSTNLDGSRIYRSTDGVIYAELATVAGSTAKYTATGLTAGGLYYFKVVSYKGEIETGPTNVYDTRFKITVDTTKAGSASDTFILQTLGSAYDAWVNWGDGSSLQNITGTPGGVSHTYAAAGTYQVAVYGTFNGIGHYTTTGDKEKIISIDNWGTIAWSNMSETFYGCSNLTANYIDFPNTSGCLNFNRTFTQCYIFNGDVSGFDVSNSNAFRNTFNLCQAFKQSLETWDVSKGTDLTWILNATDINKVGTTTNYDNTLIAWEKLDLIDGKNFSAGTAKYSAAGAAARAAIIADDSWTITDGGLAV